MAQQSIPGDITVKTISIFADSGVVNATELAKEISIYESILTPGLVAELYIADSRNILTTLNIYGGEKVRIEFSAPTRKEFKYDFYVDKVTNGSASENLRSKSFVLTLVSREVLQDKSVQVCKSYNTNISNMIEDILKTYLKTKKKISVQQTKGVQKLIIPSWNPFKAASMLRKRSYSIDDKSSLFVFFENNQGYHFKTIEKLFSEGTTGDRVFYNNETARTDITMSAFRNIISYYEPEQFNTVTRMQSGSLNNDINKFDLKTLTYKTKGSKFSAGNFKSADGSMKDPYGSGVDNFRGTVGSDTWVYEDSGNPNTFISEGLGLRVNGAAILSQGILHLEVFGDSELSAGQLIDLNILEPVAESQAPKLHPQLSGKYLITHVRHMIAPEGTTPRYTCSIEAIKGGYKNAR